MPSYFPIHVYEYPHSISSKLPKVGTTIFTTMSKLAAEENAINLSQGFPDFPIDPALADLANKHMRNGRNQYPPMAGLMPLRERIAEKMARQYNASYDPETEVTITAGATQGIFTAIMAVIKEGEEAIIFTPAYDCYAPAVELAGGKPVYVQLRSGDYAIDWKQVKKVVNRRTRMIIINNPHNPVGSILSNKDLSQLENITRDNDIVVLSDEVYEHIVFDGKEHLSVAKYPNLANRAFAVFSFGKTFHCTGWKMGYVVAPHNLMAEFRKVHQYNVFTANSFLQYALAEYMENAENYNHIHALYQKKRNVFVEALKGSKFHPLHTQGSYFQLLDYSKITDEEDTAFAIRLTKEFKVASIPVSVFYHNPVHDHVLRFCFAKEDETLLKAAELLHKV